LLAGREWVDGRDTFTCGERAGEIWRYKFRDGKVVDVDMLSWEDGLSCKADYLSITVDGFIGS
jgi:hypothetical protein